MTVPIAEFVERLLGGELAQAMHFASAMAGLRALGLVEVSRTGVLSIKRGAEKG